MLENACSCMATSAVFYLILFPCLICIRVKNYLSKHAQTWGYGKDEGLKYRLSLPALQTEQSDHEVLGALSPWATSLQKTTQKRSTCHWCPGLCALSSHVEVIHKEGHHRDNRHENVDMLSTVALRKTPNTPTTNSFWNWKTSNIANDDMMPRKVAKNRSTLCMPKIGETLQPLPAIFPRSLTYLTSLTFLLLH